MATATADEDGDQTISRTRVASRRRNRIALFSYLIQSNLTLCVNECSRIPDNQSKTAQASASHLVVQSNRLGQGSVTQVAARSAFYSPIGDWLCTRVVWLKAEGTI